MRRSVIHNVEWMLVALGLIAATTAPAARAVADETEIAPALSPKWVDTFRWRCIGPANMGGRITDLAVYEKDPCIWWVATASGGLLKTTNNGTTFEHQFDHENTVSLGAVAVAQSDPKIVWVGTGESNPRNSVSWGDGVYKSTDGGKSWKHMGLKESFQIGRIVIHPTDPAIVYVGALGRLWGPNEQRGLYKTSDGGETWEKVLHVDDKTGVIDVRMHPQNPQTLLAAAYERQRDGFDSNDPAKKWGPGSGLYKTTDGGQTWKKITAGLPSCNLGRIGIDYYRKDPNIVYIVLESEIIAKEPDNAAHMGTSGEDAEVGARLTEITKDGPAAKAGLKSGDIVVSVDDTTVHSYNDLMTEIRKRAAGDAVKIEVSRDRKSVFSELTFTERPKPTGGGRDSRRRPPFSSGLGGQRENIQQQQGPEGHEYGGVYKSTDGGESWTRINSVNPRPMYYSQLRVDPSDNNRLWVLGTSLYRSKDGGEKFTGDGARGVHVDHHAMWIDPDDGRHIILGNDGGLYVTYDRGENWDHLNHMAIGQFYHVAVGSRRNYRVYGGLQDNGSWGGPSRARTGGGPINADWFMLGWGDGFVCQVDRDDPDQVYWESQNGGMGRYNVRTAERGWIRPPRQRGTRYRFNWKTPFTLSHHNSRIYYTAGNYVFRSLNRGEKLKRISPEITRTDKGAATALAESPLDADVLYVGTNDGLLWATRDGGHEWSKLAEVREEEASPLGKITEMGKSAWRKLTKLGRAPSVPPKDAVATTQPASRPASRPADRPTTRPSRGRRGGRLLERLKQLDANGDGKIQKDEVPERMLRLFTRIDRNEDGVIDEEELKALAERPPGPPPGGPPGAGRRRPPDREPPGENGPASTTPQNSSAGPPSPADNEPPSPATSSTTSPATSPTLRQPAAGTQPASQPAAAAKPTGEDLVSGQWSARIVGEQVPEGRAEFSLSLKLEPQGKLSGVFSSPMGEGDISEGRFDPQTSKLSFVFDTGQDIVVDFSATVSGSQMTGNGDVGGGIFAFDFEATRTKVAVASAQPSAAEPKVTKDAGTGKPLGELLPGPRWVSSIEASRAKLGRVYVTFDGHRSDDDLPYVFVSEDYGQTWRSLAENLPGSAGSTRVVREDIENPDILYLGTEFGAWVTVDRGSTWTKLNSNLPTVAVHEFAIHPSAGEIVAATHGRSLWVLDVTPLRQMTKKALDAGAHLYKPNNAVYWRPEPTRGSGGTRAYVGQNPPSGAHIYYSLKEKANRISLKITDPAGQMIRELEADGQPGLHHVSWDLRRAPEDRTQAGPGRPGPARGRRPRRGRLVPSGTYVVSLTVDRQTLTQDLLIETDPDHPDYRAWEQEE